MSSVNMRCFALFLSAFLSTILLQLPVGAKPDLVKNRAAFAVAPSQPEYALEAYRQRQVNADKLRARLRRNAQNVDGMRRRDVCPQSVATALTNIVFP